MHPEVETRRLGPGYGGLSLLTLDRYQGATTTPGSEPKDAQLSARDEKSGRRQKVNIG
jgi:hypothetical protein